jgi:acyl dehydratase
MKSHTFLTRRRIMQKTQAARVLVSGLIVLALGCDSRRATSPSFGGDDLAVAASRASPSVLGQGRNIGRGVTIVLVHGAFADASGGRT